ncbi:hypothetical protein CRYUN_Cryun09bG0207700 [Craigia yunnanensis]
MGEGMVSRYWCYMCSQLVNPTTEPETKCPFCDSGFVEEMTSIRHYFNTNGIDSGSVNTLSLWAPIFLGLICGLGSSQLRITGREQINDSNSQDALDDELGRELESLLRRRRRSSSSALRMLQDMRTVAASESENSENGRDRSGRMILFDPFNDEALIVQGSFGFNQGQNLSHRAASSFGDHLMGPGWDLLLQYLCSICLEDIEIGSEAKEMPCKHKFHSGCITLWLELHSSCPVCRYQLPSNDSKIEANVNRNSEGRVGTNDAQSGSRAGTGRRYWIPITWPYDGLLTLPGSQSDSTSAPSSAATPGGASAAQTDDN